jgi:hypothetical protein
MPVTQHDGAQQAVILYSENHSAIRWPYYFHLVLWVLVVAASVVATIINGNPNWAWPVTIGLSGTILGTVITVMMWPTGIRVSVDGIRIGGVSRARRPSRGLPWGDGQRKQVFFCPWDGVRRAAVVTDRARLRDAADLRRGPGVKLGVLWAPFARAALLIEIDPRAVVVPEFRPPDSERPFFRPAHLVGNALSPVWYVPTRHPEALRAVLAQHVGPGHSDPRLPSFLRTLLEQSEVSPQPR